MPDKLPISPKPTETTPWRAADVRPFALSRKRLGLAFAIAAASDAIGAFLMPAPPFVWGMDVATAILLFFVLGWQWPLLPGLIMESIPGLGVLPFWLVVVGAIAVWGTPRPRLQR